MASHEGSRKRFKISRTESKPACSNVPSTMPTPPATNTADNASVVQKQTKCQHEQALKSLQTDIEAMRSLVTCKICDRFLYEPYALSCGHTYCYSCLREWLVTGHKKTCPDCRAHVTQKPTPNYIIRELVLVFVAKHELLPDGETSEEHHKIAKEEGEIVSKDKANTDPREGGLFKGRFDRTRRPILLPIRDPGDGVDRCPQCHWELEDDFCNQCGIPVDGEDHGFSDYDDSSDVTDDELDQLDHELDLQDVDAVWGADAQDDYSVDAENESAYSGVDPNFGMTHRGTSPDYRHRRRPEFDIREVRSSDDEGSEDSDGENSLQDFIARNEEVQYVSSDEGDETDVPATAHRPRLSHRRAAVVISDDEEEDVTSAGAAADAEQDSEDEEPVVRGGGARRPKRGRGHLLQSRSRRTQVVSSDEESSSGDDSDDNLEDHSDAAATAGFSPLDNGRSAIDDGGSDRGDYDSGSEAPSSMRPDFADDDEGDEDSDGSVDDGWGLRSPNCGTNDISLTMLVGTQADETPRATTYPTHAASHRLHTLQPHSNPHLSARDISSTGPSSPTLRRSRVHHNMGTANHRPEPTPNREFWQGRTPNVHSARLPSTHTSNSRLPDPGPQAFISNPRTHPFQLENTLASINYNQRHQQMRSQPNHWAVSGGSSQSSMAGGVDVRTAGSSGGNRVMDPGAAARRKRALSIASDDSVE